MNYWTQLSIEYANQKNYLDHLFSVYLTIPEDMRDVDKGLWKKVETAFKRKNNVELIKSLLALKLFPVKDSYVAYLRRDPLAMERNPETVNRLSGRLYQIGLEGIFEKCSEPKEANRQIGPLFKRWVQKGTLGAKILELDDFVASKGNAILSGSDSELSNFARRELNYRHDKGLDLIARFNGKYVIGEAKFLTDFGGHQNAQFQDALSTLKAKNVKAVTVAVLDGVLYIQGRNKMYKYLAQKASRYNIMSALVLREFLYQV